MANINTLLDTENVLLLAGVVGYDIVDQAKSLILQRRIPYVGANTGAASLHTPFHEEFINIRASYNDEVLAQATFLVQNSRVQRVACVYENDSFGVGGLAALVAALANVGLELVATGTYTRGLTDVEGAVEALANAPHKPQAVVMIALQAPVIKFISLFSGDARADPDCIFTVMSPGWGTSFSKEFNRTLWDRVYFFFVVPLTRDPSWAISRHFTAVYTGTSGTIAFEGYIVGRFIVEVLKRIRSTNVTSAMFLDEVYSTRMFVLDDLVVGMYSSNYSGCSQALCSCNSGLRSVYTAQLDTDVTGYLKPGLATTRYSVLECSNPVSSVIAPLLFGQLLPSWDDGWRAVALEMGRGISAAFAEANAGGGAGGREFVLLQQNYSNAKATAQNMTNRYPLAAMLGSVVPNTSLVDAPIPSLGNFETKVAATNAAFSRDEVRVQPAASLELMALANWATQRCTAVHLRATSTDTGRQLLRVMTQSVESFQRRAASTSTYSAVSDVLSSTQEGCVIAIGSDEAIVSWYNALPQYPHLHLLTLSRLAMCLMAVLPNASSLSQASRLHFPTIITDQWNTTVSNTEYSEPWKYGYVLGQAVVSTLVHSQYAYKSYTTPAELLKAWYTVRVMTSGAVTLGPYDGENCTAGLSECECNEGVRSVAIRSLSSSDVEDLYSISTCHVVYTAFLESSSNAATMAAIVGAVVGFFGVAAVGVGLYWLRTRRNHSAAPKDAHKPFCILFTDIQASTHLWATVPDIMAPALSTHHALIRQVIAKHHCYEVKTIGDSFMCATKHPDEALRFALVLQEELVQHNWGTDRIDEAYSEMIVRESWVPGCWKGLRVRVGIHYGRGNIKLDPVSHSYDYYGTVVNTAARIESVCHGGQIALSEAVFQEQGGHFPGAVWADLGLQQLRGLSQPIRLFQVLPEALSQRQFPPLRINREAERDDALLEETEPIPTNRTSVLSAKNQVLPGSICSTTSPGGAWAEKHALVVRGDVSAEDLQRHYHILQVGLSTLLAPLGRAPKQHVVRELCTHLHVPNHGTEGPNLLHTIHGLIKRVLPATVMQGLQQHGTFTADAAAYRRMTANSSGSVCEV
eukprot:GGOE01035946.1.p1 GENE.GGOE01035946.1~~GGOE01035946.1.p1  ORF type:complete len:1181 (-),score=388.33 GGOE01035946.1:228-3488(-)